VALVLAIEPDHRQATTLKRVIREIVKAELVLVESRDAAISAIDAQIPDVILVTALLSPRDEEELVTHLRALEGAEHLQTHTIPQLAGTRVDGDPKSGGGLLGKFRKKKDSEPMAGCDPELFAEEIRTFLARAAQMKTEAVSNLRSRVAQLEAQVETPELQSRSQRGSARHQTAGDAAPGDAAAAGDGSAWDSPFEWRRSEPPPGLARAEEHRGEELPPERQPLITKVPLAVLAAEEESRAAEEQREEERRRMDEERARLEAAAAAERERAERLHEEAEQQRQEAERLRVAAEAKAAAAAARAREEERKKAEAAAKIVAEKAREDERKRLEAEAKVAAQRARDEERKKAEAEAAAAAARAREDERKKAEALARAAADKAREEERKRVEAEAKAAAQRAREEERKRAEAEAKAAAERAREDERRKLEAKLTAERAKEAERRRLEAEAAAAREREAERLRKEAEAAAERKRQEERRRLEAEAAKAAEKAREEERRRLEAEQRRLEAEALVERERAERRRIEQEAAAERERAVAAERERVAAVEAERRDAALRERAARRKRNKRLNRGAGTGENGGAPLVVSDQFAEFREEYDHVGPGVFRLMPLAAWARTESPNQGSDAEPPPPDDLRELMAGWTLPPQVAGVTYATGCRIRRVVVPASGEVKKERGARPVIVSRRALDAARSNDGG
jgi:hypothetical protein